MGAKKHMDLRQTLTPKLAIVGRPNVGKSTLFNRLLGTKKAITSPIAGTTTDMNFGLCTWTTSIFTIIDTAGLDLTTEAATPAALKQQARLALQKADVILFMCDATEGLMPQDRALAQELRKSKKPIILGLNKADNPRARRSSTNSEWHKLGFGEPMPCSAINGSGIGDILDKVVNAFSELGLTSQPLPVPDVTVSIIGRPNVGKSSLLNSLAREERVIVSEVPHTTKEPQDTLITFEQNGQHKNMLIIDTVGIRKKSKVGPGIEKIGVHLSIEQIQTSDVVLLVLDAEGGVALQEKKLSALVEQLRPGLLVVVNKWDIAREQELGTSQDYAAMIRQEMPFLEWADIVFISAKTGRGVDAVLSHALRIAETRERLIPQEQLDAFIEKLKKMHHAAFVKGERRPKVFGMTQNGNKPPQFMLVIEDKNTIHPNFLRFVENRLRDEFDLLGTPIRVLARELKP
jgi:GTP-binding protein